MCITGCFIRVFHYITIIAKLPFSIIGKSNILLFDLEMQLARFVLVVLSTVWKEARMHALLQPKWRGFILAIFT